MIFICKGPNFYQRILPRTRSKLYRAKIPIKTAFLYMNAD